MTSTSTSPAAILALVLAAAAAGCTTTLAVDSPAADQDRLPPPSVETTEPSPGVETSGTVVVEVTTTTAAPSPPSTTTTTPPTSVAPSTTSTTTTTTAPEEPCVGVARAGDSLETLAARRDVTNGPRSLWIENDFDAQVVEGRRVDVCVGNGIDDTTGQARSAVGDRQTQAAIAANVQRQQTKLNELFAGYGIADLAVDGISGPLTGQRLCAARVMLDLDPTIADMQPGSDEERVLIAATALPTPSTAPTDRDRWVIIDRTCQIMFIGRGGETVYVFPTSTGSDGFETRDQERADVFRYNPALENGGWHDSTEFPVGVDNPLNGNLYKPLYFDLGQAIHGANHVPPTPESKGCARLQVGDQERLLEFLELTGVQEETWRKPEINLVVNVQGAFVPRSAHDAG